VLGLVGLLAFSFVGLFIPIGNAEQVYQIYRNNTNGSATTVTCSLNPVAKYDVIYVVVGSDNFVHTVTDSLGNSYTSQVSTDIVNNTIHAFANITTATQTHTAGADTVTVTFRASAHGSVVCYDTAGFSATKAHSDTGTGGWSSKSASYAPVVGSYTPTLANFEIAVVDGASCGSTFPTITPPLTNTNYGAQGNTGSPLVNTGTSCGTPGNFYNFVGSSYVLSSLGLATTEPWAVSSMAPTTNTANFAEVAADFAANTVQSKSLTETVGLTVSNALANPSLTETQGLSAIRQTAQVTNNEIDGLFLKYALAQQVNTEQDCLGIKVNLTKGVYVVNTGPICGAPVVQGSTLVAACTFFQLQCWAFPLMYLGMIDSFFIGVAAGFRTSEKSFLYLTFAGLTWGSMVEIVLGIMTPMLPIILIALNIAYSFRLDRIVTGSRQ
jgi:hypothetical protein